MLKKRLGWRRATKQGALAAITLGATVALTACATTAKSQTNDQAGQASARTVCHNAVIQRLKDPATVQFSQETSVGTIYGYKITGVVVSHGASGASVTAHYVCSAEGTGASKWVAEQLSVS